MPFGKVLLTGPYYEVGSIGVKIGADDAFVTLVVDPWRIAWFFGAGKERVSCAAFFLRP